MALASNVIKHDMNVVPGPIFYDYSLHLYNLLQLQKANIVLYKVLFHTSNFKWKQIVWWGKAFKSQDQCILNIPHNFLQPLLSADASCIQLTRFIEIQLDLSSFETSTDLVVKWWT